LLKHAEHAKAPAMLALPYKGVLTHTRGEADVSASECKRVKICQARRGEARLGGAAWHRLSDCAILSLWNHKYIASRGKAARNINIVPLDTVQNSVIIIVYF